MQRSYSRLSILIFAALLAGCAGSANSQSESIPAMESNKVPTEISVVVPHDSPESCPVTKPPEVLFIPPEPYPAKPPERYANQFWYGTAELWTMLGTDATWNGLPHNKDGYSQKVFWWSRDFDVSTDPSPAFTLTIERLDADTSASPMVVSKEATNASADFGTAMLTGVEIPEPGCWKITGQYEQAELSFTVRVAP